MSVSGLLERFMRMSNPSAVFQNHSPVINGSSVRQSLELAAEFVISREL